MIAIAFDRDIRPASRRQCRCAKGRARMARAQQEPSAICNAEDATIVVAHSPRSRSYLRASRHEMPHAACGGGLPPAAHATRRKAAPDHSCDPGIADPSNSLREALPYIAAAASCASFGVEPATHRRRRAIRFRSCIFLRAAWSDCHRRKLFEPWCHALRSTRGQGGIAQPRVISPKNGRDEPLPLEEVDGARILVHQ